MPGPLWRAESEDPQERRRKAEREWRRLKRLTPKQREKERRRDAEQKVEDAVRTAELKVSLAQDEVESKLRDAQRADSAYLEGSKLYFDAFRSSATLAIGSVAGVAAVSGLLGPGLDYIPVVAASVVFLLLSVMAALGGMRSVSALVYTVLGTPDLNRIRRSVEENLSALNRRERASSWCLTAGVVLFAIFALLNLAYPTGDFLETMRGLVPDDFRNGSASRSSI